MKYPEAQLVASRYHLPLEDWGFGRDDRFQGWAKKCAGGAEDVSNVQKVGSLQRSLESLKKLGNQ